MSISQDEAPKLSLAPDGGSEESDRAEREPVEELAEQDEGEGESNVVALDEHRPPPPTPGVHERVDAVEGQLGEVFELLDGLSAKVEEQGEVIELYETYGSDLVKRAIAYVAEYGEAYERFFSGRLSLRVAVEFHHEEEKREKAKRKAEGQAKSDPKRDPKGQAKAHPKAHPKPEANPFPWGKVFAGAAVVGGVYALYRLWKSNQDLRAEIEGIEVREVHYHNRNLHQHHRHEHTNVTEEHHHHRHVTEEHTHVTTPIKIVERAKPGPRGPAGPRGAKGPKGDRGARGARGARGSNGKRGAKGAKGAKGDRGAKGERASARPVPKRDVEGW